MKQNLATAVADFHSARNRAKLEGILARLTGRSAELLSYDEVRRSLRARERSSERLEDIPLDAIVGSVGRYKDFTRSFLPKQEGSKDRWARVEMAMTSMEGVPPIEVYKVGDAYFVRDGNHRVSVARQFGSEYIQGYVTEVDTKVPLSPDVEPDDLILKAEQAQFLDHTGLDEVRPEADLQVTVPGRYQVLKEHIEVHRHFMGLELERHIPYQEAAAHWHDEVYVPVVEAIRRRGILRDFPYRTETDLYVWLSEHRAELESELELSVSPDMAARDLVARFGQQPSRVMKRIGKGVLHAVTPDEFEPGPPAGQWREERLAPRQEDRLFASILVAVRGDDRGWAALEQALAVAHREEGRLWGLHVVPKDAQRRHPDAQAIQAEFGHRCDQAGVEGSLAIAVGSVHRTICERARWTDLVVTSLDHPPEPGPMARLSSGMVALIRRCPRPVLVVPDHPSAFRHPLLAYDGTSKAREALFVATYVAGRWDAPLTVISVTEGDRIGASTLEEARDYLEAHGIDATYEAVEAQQHDGVGDAILRAAANRRCDLILMGGYGVGPMVEAVIGSAVDQALRKSRWPLLICR